MLRIAGRRLLSVSSWRSSPAAASSTLSKNPINTTGGDSSSSDDHGQSTAFFSNLFPLIPHQCHIPSRASVFCRVLWSMARRVDFISSITPDRHDWRLKVRIIRLWTIPNLVNPEQINTIEMILLDEKSGRIHASVKSSLVERFKEMLIEGVGYCMTNFIVGYNTAKSKSTRHKFKLNFMATTDVSPPIELNIPKEGFLFVSFVDLSSNMDESYLIDVIGEIVENGDLIQSTKDGKITNRIDVVLEDTENNQLVCTLWGNFAEELCSYLTGTIQGPNILVLQSCRVNNYQGKVRVTNTYYGSRMLINPTINEAIDFKNKRVNTEESQSQRVSQLSGPTTYSLADDFLVHTEKITIDDILESKKVGTFVTCATIIEIDNTYGWFYNSCNKCSRKVEPAGRTWYCDKCEDFVHYPMQRFKIKVRVIDETGSTFFLLFDREAVQLLGKTVTDVLSSTSKKDPEQDERDYPLELDCLLDKKMLFKVKIKEENLSKSWDTCAVQRVTDDDTLIEKFGTSLITEQEPTDCIERNQEVDVINKDSFSDETYGISPNSTPSKRTLGNDMVELSDPGNEQHSQLSTNKMWKNIKIEK